MSVITALTDDRARTAAKADPRLNLIGSRWVTGEGAVTRPMN